MTRIGTLKRREEREREREREMRMAVDDVTMQGGI